MSTDNLIIENVNKRYGRISALVDINLKLPITSIALLGPNGAGKTTLLRILATVIDSDSGRISFRDIDWKRPRQVKPCIGYLPQHFNFYQYLTVKETLEYIAVLKRVPAEQSRLAIKQLLQETNLTAVCNQRIGTLSGGTRRRVGIAQALLSNPPILLIDEPTAGLDPEERIRFWSLLTRHAAGRLVLISTHIAADAEMLCSHAIIINKGHVIDYAPIADLKGKAQGFVHERLLQIEEFALFSGNHRVISSRPVNEGTLIIRYLDKSASAGQSKIKPTLADAYALLVDGEDSKHDRRDFTIASGLGNGIL